MPIPRSRAQVLEMVECSFEKLDRELCEAGPEMGELHCVEDWTVKDLIAVRAWWTASVVKWIEAGKKAVELELPAPGYGEHSNRRGHRPDFRLRR